MNRTPDSPNTSDPWEVKPESRRGVVALIPVVEGGNDAAKNGWTVLDVRFTFDRENGPVVTPILSQTPDREPLTDEEREAGVLSYRRASYGGNARLEDFDTVDELIDSIYERLTRGRTSESMAANDRVEYHMRALIRAARQIHVGDEQIVEALRQILDDERVT